MTVHRFPSADKAPQWTERRILEELNRLHHHASLHPIELCRLVFGTTKVNASAVNSALGRLHNRRLIRRSGPYGGGRCWRITEAGRAALALDDALAEPFMGGGEAS